MSHYLCLQNIETISVLQNIFFFLQPKPPPVVQFFHALQPALFRQHSLQFEIIYRHRTFHLRDGRERYAEQQQAMDSSSIVSLPMEHGSSLQLTAQMGDDYFAWAELFARFRLAAVRLKMSITYSFSTRNKRELAANKMGALMPKYAIRSRSRPPIHELFGKAVVLNSPCLWLDFCARTCTHTMLDDERVVTALIKWMLHENDDCNCATGNEQNSSIVGGRNDSFVEPSFDGDNSDHIAERRAKSNQQHWQPPPLAGYERLLHIGSERTSLNMAEVIHFIKALINVSK